jgi:adrenodoxin-NADP+ reductase
VVTSLGFHGEPTTSFYDPALGHIRTISDRVASSSGTVFKNVYASGWAATGAKGVLASTMMNAYSVADTILSDWFPKDGRLRTTGPSSPGLHDAAEIILNPDPHSHDPPPEILAGLREGVVTSYEGWKAVDAEEVRRGEMVGKERERMGWEDVRQFLTKEPVTFGL